MRRVYNGAVHCGHPVDRSPERVKKQIAAFEAQIEGLEVKHVTAGLTHQESSRLNWARQASDLHQGKLDRLLMHIRDYGADERPCMQVKGAGTEHKGVGLCRRHCVCGGREGGHLSPSTRGLQDRELMDIIEDMERSGEELLNLEPDVIKLRAKIKLFLNAKQNDYSPETVMSLTLLFNQVRAMVDTIMKAKARAAIPLDIFNLLMFRMGEVVTKYVTDPSVLDRITSDWNKISVETGAKTRKQIAERVK